MKLLLYTAGLFLLLSACKKDEDSDACMKLEGKWTADSWLEDGEQFLGDTIFIISSVLEFKTLVEDMGDVEWTISYTLGGPETIIGSYMVNNSCDEIVITPKAGIGTTYQFMIDGSKLTLESHDNNVHVVQVYERQ